MPFGYVLGGLTAGTAGALAAGGAAALTALYFLRRRRLRVPVAFAPLWFAAGGERRVERLARRLRRLLSLALQLAIFACVVLAAADPRPAVEASARGRNIVVLIDRSASMSARDEQSGATRLERARTLAREVIDGLGAGDRAMVAGFASGVTAATGFDDDRGRLTAAVAGVAPSEEPGDLPAALDFAASVLRGRARPTLVLVSDGSGSTPGPLSPASGPLSSAAAEERVGERRSGALGGIDVRYLPVGRRRDNLAIVAFSARRLPADPSSVEVALAVQSFRDRPADVTLAITAGPARIPIARRRVHLPPGARAAEILADVAAPDPRLEARIEGADDDLPLDDRAYAVIPERPRLRVVVAGPRDLYLDGALLGLGSAVRIERAAPDAAARAPAGAADVVIFDGALPATAPETGRFLYIDPHGPGSPWPDRGTARAPVISDVVRDHPLLEHVSLADLNVGAARRLVLGAGDVAVARALATPLLIARARPGLRAVALAFDVRRSDLPLRGAFPLLVANALTWLSDRRSAEALAFPTGRTVRVTLPQGEGPAPARDAAAEVRAPDGTTSRAPVIAGAVSLPLPRAGFYEVARARAAGGAAGTPTRIAANLASTAESDTAPEPRLRIGDRTPPRPDPPRPRPRRPLWQLAAAAALGLLLLEWITFHRRLTV